MSTRPYIKPYPIVINGAMASTITSAPTIITNMTGVGYDISWTGAPVGTFSVQISNTVTLDAKGNVANVGNWTPVTLSAAVTAAGVPDNAFINLAGLESYAVRLVYTASSGTGVLNAVVSSKVQ